MKKQRNNHLLPTRLTIWIFFFAGTVLSANPTQTLNLGEIIELKDTLQSIQTELELVKKEALKEQPAPPVNSGTVDKPEDTPSNMKSDEFIPTREDMEAKKVFPEQKNFPVILPNEKTQIPELEKNAPWSAVEITSSRNDSANYLIISPRLIMTDDLNYAFPSAPNGEIKTGTGYGAHFSLGKKMNNWEFGLSIGFENTPFDELNWMGSSYEAKGNLSSYQILFTPGYRFQISNSVSFYTGLGLGFAARHDHYEINFLSPRTLNQENIVFLGQLNLSLALHLTESSSMFFGYRYGFTEDSGPFDSLSTHGLEIGAIWAL